MAAVWSNANGRLWLGETELRSPFYQDRNVVADGTFVERGVFLGHDILNCRTLFLGEALDQTVNDSHEGFGFPDHCKSFDLTISRVNGNYSRALGADAAIPAPGNPKKSCDGNYSATSGVHSVGTGRIGRDPIMNADEKTIVSSCHELATGDEIDARYKGALVHRGRVTERAPDHGLFWIMDDLTGGRRLLDMAELEITRVQRPVIPHDADTEPAAA
jgi:hypothetical protein